MRSKFITAMSRQDSPIMDWRDEASALIDDMKNYVNKIEISDRHQSSDMRIYLEIETLEGITFIVLMSANGFLVCDSETSKQQSESCGNNSDNAIARGTNKPVESSFKIYETINSLLDDNSPKYREAFAEDLYNKMRSLK